MRRKLTELEKEIFGLKAQQKDFENTEKIYAYRIEQETKKNFQSFELSLSELRNKLDRYFIYLKFAFLMSLQ